MGCVNSTTATYPGNRRVAQPIYQPPDSDYTQVDATTAVANAHFVTCPGGNALRLEGKPHRSDGTTNYNTTTNNNGGGQPTYISVTLPPGVNSGDVIHVRAPDGRLNAITVPPGMGPGATFTVEFSDDTPAPPKEEELTPGVYVPTVMAVADEERRPLVNNGGGNNDNNVVVATAVPLANGKY
eukprot:CAMPEP_0201739698 /NCGR_PEP_ID=MMETSP0593-20130828/45920_1 /ASSEMBLY_ACC=CAM_ASM_000672 /TAXON_ID=267983 /ORGANISM="Skeletonema japonicum, Strain CCMP2506" /LENGTH=182 /DNA_ID=CAMNT_0048233989 /DNA_START=122 /DNA_END=670 /DNA_ORIENTATION=-